MDECCVVEFAMSLFVSGGGAEGACGGSENCCGFGRCDDGRECGW